MIVVCIFGSYAHASNFEIAPVVLELSDARPAGTIRFVNKDDHQISLQVRTNDWIQVDGEDQLTPNNKVLLVSPPIFTLAPGAAQTIRIVTREKGVTAEFASRLYIDEIPTPSKEAAINFKFRISMPIFLEPANAPVIKMEWRLIAGVGSTGPQLQLRNAGNRRLKLLDVGLILPDGKKLMPKAQPNSYTLTGGSRTYGFASDPAIKAGATIKVSAIADIAPYETTVVVAP